MRLAGQQVVDGGGQGVGVVEVVLVEREVGRVGQPGRDGSALVFESARGGYLTLGQARYTFKKATPAVEGCDGVRLHDLRHTCASLAISAGANVKVVQRAARATRRRC